jgi:ribonucleotide monophosphatase NagD (HAD superfamily)
LRLTKARKLSQLVGVQISADQIVMSHSPLRMLKKFHHKRCLISGQGPIVEIAKNLGFISVLTIDDLKYNYPHLDVVDHKRRNFAPCVLGRYFPPIEAIILFGESTAWETNLQLIIDVLMCDGKLYNEVSTKNFPRVNLPIFACNTDMIWMAG